MKPAISIAGLLLAFATATLPVAAEPAHLAVARKLVSQLALTNTTYEHGTPNVSFTVPVAAHTDCSGFMDALLEHTYGYTTNQFKAWFGIHRPSADYYHDTILQQRGFQLIADFRKVQPGDVLAVKYKFPQPKSTGHIMLVSALPRRMPAVNPATPGQQWEWQVPVIDSAMSGHSAPDTRHQPDAKDHDGLGSGVISVYTGTDGKVAGFAWRVSGAKFRAQDEEHMVIGRFKPGFKP